MPTYTSAHTFSDISTKDQIIPSSMEKSSNESQHVVQLAQEVLSLAEASATQGLSLQEKLLKSIRKLQIAAEGPARYVIRKRQQVRWKIFQTLHGFLRPTGVLGD